MRPVVSIDPVPSVDIRERVPEWLMSHILRNRRRPGDRLPTEGDLALRHRFSRTVVREALRSVDALEVIGSRQRSGWSVRGFDLDALTGGLAYSLAFDTARVRDLLAVRRVLEVAFLRAEAPGQRSDRREEGFGPAFR